ncbi:MAG TPA: tetratricopeptide repeat protein, partial [Gemmatimonadota bacterium]|nr:tetratricopeptide repeat protein [Gemmatimonadota bacterium]
EILDGLGVVQDMEALPLVVEKDGLQETAVVRPAGRLEVRGHNPAAGVDQTGWANMRGPGETPLWLRHPERVYFAEFVPADGTLYVAYRGVVDSPHPPGNVEFWRQTFALADSMPVERLVIDLRENTGGNSFFNRQVVRGILARPDLDRPDRLFVIIAPRTFSAAMNLALDLEQWSNATFVGAPTGNATMFFGDHRTLVLPASGMTVNVSSLPWHPVDPRDRRDFLAPDLYTPMTAADYRGNVDPAMRAILARTEGPSLAERVEAAVVAGDAEGAAALVRAAAAEPLYRFRSPEADINALGYRLLRDHRAEEAIAVFRINAEVFPSSPNVWDSLGEALLAAGRRDEGIAAYRRALELEPQFASALQALERLGVPATAGS